MGDQSGVRLAVVNIEKYNGRKTTSNMFQVCMFGTLKDAIKVNGVLDAFLRKKGTQPTKKTLS